MRITPNPTFKAAVGPHRPGEALVKLRAGLALQSDFCADYQSRLLETLPLGSQRSGFEEEVLHLKLPPGVSTAEALQRMGQDPRVEYAAPNTLYFPDATTPNDLTTQLYGLKKIQAEAAWDLTTGSHNGPVVAVLDSGVDYQHPDLQSNIWVNPGEIPGNQRDDDGNGVVDDVHGYASGFQSGDPKGKDQHGTHVSGTIAAVGNNGQGVVGVNWKARLMAINIFGGFGADAASITKALHYAAQMGARIASNSWGGGVFNPVVYEAFKNSPLLHICAAGNQGRDNDLKPHYPASFELPNVISVAATDDRDQLPRFSNYGATSVDLAAPGQQITSTVPQAGYAELSGTSMATPHVSGVAALILNRFPQASNREIRARILGGVDKISNLQGKVVSGGRLNAWKSLETDSVPPGAPQRLVAKAQSPHQVGLSWIASGDDGQQGAATFYDVRYALQPMAEGTPGPGQIAFQEATPLASDLPAPSGSQEGLTFKLLPSAQPRTLYCAVRATDNVGQDSPLAQTRCQLPAAQMALEAPAGSTKDWTSSGGWEVTALPELGSVWTDSPTGEYANNLDISLSTAPFSLKGMKASKLLFEGKYSIEAEKDRLSLEASQDGGKSWKSLKTFEGDSPWKIHEVDLSAYDNRPSLQLRFHLKTDSTGRRDGFYLGRAAVSSGS